MTASRRLHPQFTFVFLAILVNVAASLMVNAFADPGRRRIISFAAACDMTITVTGLYYWVIVRPGLRPKATLIFVAFLGLMRASFAFPDAIPGKAWLAGGAEFAVITAVFWGFSRWRKLESSDPESRIGATVAAIIPFNVAARALAGELAVIYYAFAWRVKPHVPAGARAFSLHKRGGMNDLLLFLGLASLLEVVPVHLIVARWSVMAAWILTGLSLYGAVWAMAIGRSFALRPSLVGAEEIIIRFGLLFSLRIPVACVKTISCAPVSDALILPRNTPAGVFLEFTRPLTAEKMFGITKLVEAIGVSADDAPGFEQALRDAVEP